MSAVPARTTRLLRQVLDDPRHPLTPAAIRVERSSARNDKGSARQTALTVWFNEGPSLPGPAAAGPSPRAIAGTVAFVGMIALGALGVMAAQRQPELVGLLQPSRSVDPPGAQD